VTAKLLKSARDVIYKTRELDRGLGKYVERISRFIWPWREYRLLVVAGCLCLLDFVTTYILLGMTGRNDVYESGLIASRALATGGFPFLLAVDIIAMVVLSLLAFVARLFYVKRGLEDYGRAAFVFILIPYIVVTAVVIVNTVIMLLG